MSQAVRTTLVIREAQERMALLPNYYRWIASHFSDLLHGTVLELGCGSGHVLRHYLDRVERVVGVDVDPDLLARLRDAFPGGKVRAVRADLRGEWSGLEGIRADAVVALDVLEHFEDDRAFVRKMSASLAPGGRAVLKVPAQARLYGGIDRASGHFRRYDARGLEELMSSCGFRTLRLRQMNPAGAWAYARKRDRPSSFSGTFAPWKLKLVNALIPAIALLDRVPGLAGLSLVGVFEKQDRS